MKEIKKVAIYARVSKEDQGTIGEQLKNLIEYAQSKDWQWKEKDIFKDERPATSVHGRPEFQGLLERVRAKKYDAVVVRHSDRITRTDDLEEWGLIMGTFQKSKTLIASPHEGITDITTLGGKMVEFTKGLMSSEENKKRIERTTQTKQASLDEGIYRQSGSVCFGYGVLPGNRAKKIPARVAQVKSEVQILKLIYDLIVKEGLSASKVCVHLNQKGIKTKRGKDWRPATLCSILRNTALYGEIISNRWVQKGKKMVQRPEEEWKIAYIPEPVFSKLEWDRIQAKISRAKGRPAKREGIFLCRGLLKCELCGSNYTTFFGGGKKYYYACPCRRIPEAKLINGQKPCENSPLMRQQLMDDYIWVEVVKMFVMPSKFIGQWMDKRTAAKEAKKDSAEMKSLEAQLEHQRKKYRYWLDRGEEAEELGYVKGKLDHWKALMALTKEKIEQVQQRLEALEDAKGQGDRLKQAVEALEKVTLDKLVPSASKTHRELAKKFTKEKIMAQILLNLPWEKKRQLLEAIVGTQKILVKPSEHTHKVKPYWAARPISANFEYYFQGTLDVDRIVEILEGVEETELLKSLNGSWYR
jgi:DNA invertase Pin-like site-specific DNA recombinase